MTKMITEKDAELFEKSAREQYKESVYTKIEGYNDWLRGGANAYEVAAEHIMRKLEDKIKITIKDAELFEEFARENIKQAKNNKINGMDDWLIGRGSAYEVVANHIRRNIK